MPLDHALDHGSSGMKCTARSLTSMLRPNTQQSTIRHDGARSAGPNKCAWRPKSTQTWTKTLERLRNYSCRLRTRTRLWLGIWEVATWHFLRAPEVLRQGPRHPRSQTSPAWTTSAVLPSSTEKTARSLHAPQLLSGCPLPSVRFHAGSVPTGHSAHLWGASGGSSPHRWI